MSYSPEICVIDDNKDKIHNIIKIDNLYRYIRLIVIILITVITINSIINEEDHIQTLIIYYIISSSISNYTNIYLTGLNRNRYTKYLNGQYTTLVNLHIYLNNGYRYEDFEQYVVEIVGNRLFIILKESYYFNLFKKSCDYTPLEEIQYYLIIMLYCIGFLHLPEKTIFYVIDHQPRQKQF